MTTERALLLVAAAALVGLSFYIAVFVIPDQKSVRHQVAIVLAVLAQVGCAFLFFVVATMAP